MVPQFPRFQRLNHKCKEDIESFVSHYKPYSTFNYTNLYAWDLEGKRRVTFLNDNLVVEQVDHASNSRFYTFIGQKKPVSTAKELLAHAQKHYGNGQIRLLSQPIKNKLTRAKLPITETREHSEYIYSVKSLAELSGKKLKSKRVLANRFTRENPNAEFNIENIHSLKIRREIVRLIKRWSQNKKHSGKDYDYKNEKKALKRLLSNGKDTELVLSCIRDNGAIIAFSIDEILPRRKAIGHFVKADTTYKGIYEYINQQTAEYLLSQGVKEWNWQQDLGLEGLRKLKKSYHPKELLHKYSVSLD